MRTIIWACLATFAWAASVVPGVGAAQGKVFQAGVCAMDVTPTKFPVIVNGGFLEASASHAQDRLFARCLVLEDGSQRIALVVVDSCMMPRDFLDEVKKLAQDTTGIPAERILISATHTHSAPAAMGCLGSRADAEYVKYLGPQIVRGLHLALKNLQPARVGWTVVNDPAHTHCRRWIYRPDRMLTDPFGDRTVRANMHPGHQNPNTIGPAGPVDTGLSLLSLQTSQGKPLALLANYSQHYYGTSPVSADYCGRFCSQIEKLLEGKDPSFMAVMSQGTSGDLMWPDYGEPAPRRDLNAYAAELAKVALGAYQDIRYQDWVPLAMKETRLTLQRRVPDENRLAWAKKIDTAMQGRMPRNREEVYAREQIYLHAQPSVELRLQALRIGDLGITAIPNEVFGITGLKIKAQSPLQPTFNIELANGSEGYIPPPEQHKLGGYTTWPARTAGLEVQAEPRIVESLLTLLEEVSGKKRQALAYWEGNYNRTVRAGKPLAYWRFEEFGGPRAVDSSGNERHGIYEDGIAFYLEGPEGKAFTDQSTNRAIHLAGGRMAAKIPGLGKSYSVEGWIWNGLPGDARPVAGYFFSRGPESDKETPGDHLGVGGAKLGQGKLLFFNGNQKNQALVGKSEIPLKAWQHVVLVRDAGKVSVYLNGSLDIYGDADITNTGEQIFLGGRNDKFATWEGKLDEFSLYDRALSAEEVVRHFKAAGRITVGTRIDSPLTPEQAQPLFRLPPGLRIELVAAEPDVQSPVAMTFDEEGRMFVVEMLDYPFPEKGKPPAGRIRMLKDLDGSGRYKAVGVLADQLLFANGVMPWQGGLVVTSAPYIYFLKDTDGDGRADQRQILYEGFATENPQLRVSHPNLGLDNWIYVVNGLRGGQVKVSHRPGTSPINISGRDFRFDLLRQREEAITGMGQYGNTFDDWGNRFVCTNRNHWIHMVLPEHYIRRNPFLAVPPPKRDDQGPGGSAKVYPVSKGEVTFAEHFGSFTACCGVFSYRGNLLPQAFRGSIYTCEPTGNLVHQEVLLPNGASFTGLPARKGVEFLATPDDWCRPVFLTQGPDGALYVVDMYRRVIEHPEWMPKELRTRPDLNLGKEMGRIWRIVPENYKLLAGRASDGTRVNGKTTLQKLVELLAHPDSWWRTTAQRLLLLHQGPDWPAEELARMVKESPSPLARVHAGWLLEHRGKFTEDLVLALLRHEHVRVREQGVRLAEPWLGKSKVVGEEVLRLARDEDAHLRFQVALSLGQWNDDCILPALVHIALTDAEDSWVRMAVASSVPERTGALLGKILQARPEAKPAQVQLAQELATLVGSRRDPEEVLSLVERILSLTGKDTGTWQLALRRGLAEGLQRRGSSLAKFFTSLPANKQELLPRLDRLLDQTLVIAQDSKQEPTKRIDAIGQLAHLDYKKAGPILNRLLQEEVSPDLSLAAVRSLAVFSHPEVAANLVKPWKKYHVTVQREVLEILLSSPERTLALVKELEAGRIPPGDIDSVRRLQLLNHRRSDVRERAKNILATVPTAQRQEVLEKYRPALQLTGDPYKGKVVFQKATCISCHRLTDVGISIGSNLEDVRTRSLDALLVDILDPHAAIDANFINYLVSLKNGKVLTGLIAAESGSSITLLRGDKQTDVVLRQDIEEIVSTGKSLMPEDLEKQINLQEMADLLAFLKRWPEVGASKK